MKGGESQFFSLMLNAGKVQICAFSTKERFCRTEAPSGMLGLGLPGNVPKDMSNA